MNILRKIGLVILLAGIVLVGLGGGCPFKGEDGDDGLSGSSGTPGQDALISNNSYFFTPNANPDAISITEISLTGVEAGWQTVSVYASWSGTAWTELPCYSEFTGFFYEHEVFILNGSVQVETYEDGVLYAGDALFAGECMVVVQTFNH